MEPRHIGSNERAELIKLYSQYEFKEVEFDNDSVDDRSYLTDLNELGKDGWHVVAADWSDDGILLVLQRQTFSIANAIKRSGHGS